MKFTLSKVLLLLLLGTGAIAQDEFDLSDALDDSGPEPTKQQQKPTKKPKSGGELDLLDAFGPDLTPTKKPKKPSSGDSAGGFGFNLEDAVGPDSKTDRPAVKPPKSGGGGGTFDDSDLFDVSQGDYKPEGGRSGGRAMDPGSNPQGGADQPEDPEHEWGQILKQLYANVPEEFYMWLSNLKQVITPLLERVQDLLQALV